jgi:hypothetical protein
MVRKNLLLSQCRFDLEIALQKEVDLLSARQVATVFQKEIISGTCLYRRTDLTNDCHQDKI